MVSVAVAIVTEAGPQVGLGHLSRSSNLAQALMDQGASVQLFIRAEQSLVSSWCEARGLEGIAVESLQDSKIAVFPADLWVLDSYEFDARCQIGLNHEQALRVLIDDHQDRDYSWVDIVVNPVPGVIPLFAPRAEMLGGPEYALLDPAFVAQRRRVDSAQLHRSPLPRRPQRVGLLFGGMDTARLGPQAAIQVEEAFPAAEIHVFGRADWSSAAPQCIRHGLLSPQLLAEALVTMDLVLATPSTVAWELATLGIPGVLVQTASNQREIALALEGHAGVQVAKSVSSAELIAFWEALDGEALGEWRGLCDGAGASRAAGRLLALFESSLH